MKGWVFNIGMIVVAFLSVMAGLQMMLHILRGTGMIE